MQYSSQEPVHVVSGNRRIPGMVVEVKIGTGIYEVLVRGRTLFFYIETGQSIESDHVWLEPINGQRIIEEQQSPVLPDDAIITAFHDARKAFIRDDQAKISQIARQLCVCDLSCRPSVADVLDLCAKAKEIKTLLRQFAISKEDEPSAKMIESVRTYIR